MSVQGLIKNQIVTRSHKLKAKMNLDNIIKQSWDKNIIEIVKK